MIKNKKKIIFIIDKENYIRNHILSKTLEVLEKNFDIIYLIEKKLINTATKKIFKHKLYFNYQKDKYDNIFNNYLNIIAYYYRDRSKFFRIRLKRLFRTDLRLFNEGNFFLKVPLIIIYNYINIFVIKFLGSKAIYKFYEDNKILKTPINKSLRSAIEKNISDMVIMPTNAHGKIEFDVVRICKQLKIKSYFIVDNWDNLSSKTVLIQKPDYLGVWGTQTKVHAKKIQNMSYKNIDIIGSGKYQSFFRLRNKNFNKSNKYVLFLGTSWSWDEESVLDIIDYEITNNKSIYQDLKIIYRPHPLRQKKTNVTELKNKWKNIHLDNQINLNYFNSRLMPDLNYYPKLISNSIFVMGGLTTMLLEVSIFYKNYLAIGFDDKKSFLNQKLALDWFPHLKNISKLSNIKISSNEKNMLLKFRSLFFNNKIKSKRTLDKKLDFFLSLDTKNYKNHLFNCIKQKIE